MSVFVKEIDGQGTEIVHLLEPFQGDEFTYCNRSIVEAVDRGFIGKFCSGPANCIECHEAVNKHKKRIQNILWSRNMRRSKEEGNNP